MVVKEEMKFCKKCHKVVIKVVTKETNLDRICKCDRTADFLVSDLQSISENNTCGEKRCGSKRMVNKAFTDSAVNVIFLNEIKECDE